MQRSYLSPSRERTCGGVNAHVIGSRQELATVGRCFERRPLWRGARHLRSRPSHDDPRGAPPMAGETRRHRHGAAGRHPACRPVERRSRRLSRCSPATTSRRATRSRCCRASSSPMATSPSMTLTFGPGPPCSRVRTPTRCCRPHCCSPSCRIWPPGSWRRRSRSGPAPSGRSVLLRRNGCRPLAAALGGATFGLGGFVSSQIVHIDFVAASAALVWCLVALDGMVRGEPHRRAPWALVLAIAVGCVGLSGSPDIVDRHRRGARRLRGPPVDRRRAVAGSPAWAGPPPAALPGWLSAPCSGCPAAEFVAVSERAHAGYAFAASGSVSPAELLISVVPHVLGGGPIGLETYTGPYNLAELDAYCGILSLVAVVALASRWRSRARQPLEGLVPHRRPRPAVGPRLKHSPRTRPHPPPPRGRAAPAEPGAHPLLAGLVDAARPLGRGPARVRAGRAETGGDRRRDGGAPRRARPPVRHCPDGQALWGAPRRGGGVRLVARGHRPLPFGRRRHRPGGRRHCDPRPLLAQATARGSDRRPRDSRPPRVHGRPVLAWHPSTRERSKPTARCETQLAARLGGGGRFVIVDPARSDGIALDQVGASDFNVLSGLSSAQGYGSLTWGPYASATGDPQPGRSRPGRLGDGRPRLARRPCAAHRPR